MAKGSPFPAEQKRLARPRAVALHRRARRRRRGRAAARGQRLLSPRVLLGPQDRPRCADPERIRSGRGELRLGRHGRCALLVFVPAYGAFASRVNRVWLISRRHAVLRLAPPDLLRCSARPACSIGVAFYIWIGVFNMVVVAQFWAFANDLYTTERGKRLFPLVGVGASLGASSARRLAAYFFEGIGPVHADAHRGVRTAGARGLTISCTAARAIARTRRRTRRDEAGRRPRRVQAGVQAALSAAHRDAGARLQPGQHARRVHAEHAHHRGSARGRSPPGPPDGRDQASLIGTLSGTVQTYVNLLASCCRRSSSRASSGTSACAARCSSCRRSR